MDFLKKKANDLASASQAVPSASEAASAPVLPTSALPVTTSAEASVAAESARRTRSAFFMTMVS